MMPQRIIIKSSGLAGVCKTIRELIEQSDCREAMEEANDKKEIIDKLKKVRDYSAGNCKVNTRCNTCPQNDSAVSICGFGNYSDVDIRTIVEYMEKLS